MDAVTPANKEKHFLVIGLCATATPDEPVTHVKLEAVACRVKYLLWRAAGCGAVASGMEDVAPPAPLDELDGRLARLGDGVRFRRSPMVGRHPALLFHQVHPVHGVGRRGIDGDVGAP